MVNKTRFLKLKEQIHWKEVDDLKAHAAKLHMAEQERLLAPGEKKKLSCQICQEASDAHFIETGRHILIAHNTLARHAKGGEILN
jgi:hypothetical protein